MKKVLNSKKIIIIIVSISILLVLLLFLIYKNNFNSSLNINNINKALISGKKEIKKEKIILEKKDIKDKKYILKVMDYMIKIHDINDELKKLTNLKNIGKVNDNEKDIEKINKELKKLEKKVKKINIKKCLKFNTNVIKYNSDLLTISDFLNTNKESYKLEGSKIIFLKRKIFLEYEKIDKNKYFKYKLIDDKEGPVIKADNISISVGTNIDLNEKVSCYDEVDDEVKCNITGDYDTNKEGKYSLKIEAKDESDNTSSKEIILSVVAVKKVNNSNKNPYYAEVIRNQNVVVIYGLDENQEYTKIVKVFICSVGLNNNTPTGTFTTSDKYVWRALYGGVYGQYATRIVGSILFHSVPYYSQDKGNIESEEFNKLGNAASMGCVRMTVRDVKWIYDNCPKGMTVKIYDGDLPRGVSKPNSPKIDLNSPNKGWDPTDPDSNNPWK